jgi:ribosomal protein S18 acetylase RimI-like enzyme
MDEREGGRGTGEADGIRIEAVTAALLPTYRDVRIAALIDSPRAFWTTYEQASSRTDDLWATWLDEGPKTWLAFAGDSPVGTVGLWRGDDQPHDEITLVGMWVATVVRGTDVAERLVRTALGAAADAGVRRVVLDVAHENARAWAFYSRMGFRATGEVGSMPWDPAVTEESMVLDLQRGS